MLYLPFDEALSRAVTFQLTGAMNSADLADKIEFQFPPKITTDSRKGEWKDQELPGTEPVAVYFKSGPREMLFTCTYIVDGGIWTTTKVSKMVRTLRGYFARARALGDTRNLIINFKMWLYTGQQAMTCRIKSIDVKHSETVVAPCSNVDLAYPLRTDIALELRLWTKGGGQQTQNLAGLQPDEKPAWY